MVVAEDRRALPGVGAEVVGAGAEVDRGAERRVVDVLRVAPAVVVGVDPDDRPGRRDELHRADRAVEARVAVVLPGVGVADQRRAVRAVEHGAEDAGLGDALVGQHVAAGAAVVGLDPPDRGDQLPGQVAGAVGGVDDRRRPLVGRERDRGDAAGGGGRHDARDVAADAGGEGAGGGQAGRGADGLAPGPGCRRAASRSRRRDGVGAGGGEARGPGHGEQGQREQGGRLLRASEPRDRHRPVPPRGAVRRGSSSRPPVWPPERATRHAGPRLREQASLPVTGSNERRPEDVTQASIAAGLAPSDTMAR